MFVLARRLNIPKIEYPRIRIFLPQRRQDAKFRIILRSTTKHTNDTKTRKLSGPNFPVFRAFRGSIFGCRCAPTGEPLFPSPVWEKACTAIAANLRGARKFFGDLECSNLGIDSRQACPESHRRGAKTLSSDLLSFRPQGEIFLRSLAFPRDDGHRPVTFAPWRPFDFAQDMLCGRYSEAERCAKRTLQKPSCPEPVVSSVEPCLRGEYSSTINPEEEVKIFHFPLMYFAASVAAT